MELRWAVLGTARIAATAVIPAIRASHNGRLVAVASRDGGRARGFAAEHGIPEPVEGYDALLERDDVDAVYIPLPNSEHLGWAVRAAERGKHVLCEKPLALTAAECEEMFAAAASHGVRLMEAFMYRFHPRTERLLRMVRDGVIGEVRAIRSTFSFPLTRPHDIRLKPELGGGALMDVGCYCVNVSRALHGAEPAEVHAFAKWGDTGIDVRLAGALCFADDVVAQFDCGFDVALRQLVEVAGSDGSLEVHAAFRPGTVATVIVERHGSAEPRRHTIAAADEYRLMVEHFGDAVLNGSEPRLDARDAAGGMRAIEALYRSARDGGRPVRPS